MKFFRPEYVFRPSQIVRRLAYSARLTRNNSTGALPWGLQVEFDPGELHGRAVLTLGLSDLRTSELIARIVGTGDTSVDIGANIGLMTSLMAKSAGSTGSVFAFEPHPRTRVILEANVQFWSRSSVPAAKVIVLPYAVSTESGRSNLHEPTCFESNSGLASLEAREADTKKLTSSIEVETVSYDEWAKELGNVRLVKIDVEGHEDQVLLGMKSSLASKKVDFLIFEEFRPLPSPATVFLENLGYKCFLIDRSFFGPRLKDVNHGPEGLVGEATNILAVKRGESLEGLQSPGWRCLR